MITINKVRRNTKPVFGHGIRGLDDEWICVHSGPCGTKPIKSYSAWLGVLRSCYDQSSKGYKHCAEGSIIPRVVGKSWLYFPSFKTWYDLNVSLYLGEYDTTWEVCSFNADVLEDSTCMLVPSSIRRMFQYRGKGAGVHTRTEEVEKRFRCAISGKSFHTVEDAYESYKEHKLSKLEVELDKYPLLKELKGDQIRAKLLSLLMEE